MRLNGPSFWSLDFTAPHGRRLVIGNYGSATRYPFNSPAIPGLDVSGDGGGCNTLTGWFEVVEYQLDSNGQVAKLAPKMAGPGAAAARFLILTKL